MTIKQYIDHFNSILQNPIITDKSGNNLDNTMGIEQITDKFMQVKMNCGTVYLIGNGGSNGIVSHASVDLLNTCKIKAVPLTDSSQLTCFANDYGYENIFAKPLETLISKDDILIAVSSSGSSKNIINAVHTSNKKGAFIITLSGFNQDNLLKQLGNINLWLNSNHYGIVELGHALLLHYISDKFSDKTV